MLWLCVQFRDPSQWRVVGQMPFKKDREYNFRTGRYKTVYRQSKYVYPVPENVSSFVAGHKIIEAETEKEALVKCQEN